MHPLVLKRKEQVFPYIINEGEKNLEHLCEISSYADRVNDELLLSIIKDNANTEYGKRYDFASINSVKEYQERVPITDYSDYEEYISRMLEGESGLLINEKPAFFYTTSGGSGKYKKIPGSSKNMEISDKYLTSLLYAEIAREHGNIWLNGNTFLMASYKVKKEKCGAVSGSISGRRLETLRDRIPYMFTSPEICIFPEEDVDTTYMHIRFALADETLVDFNSTFASVLFEVIHEIEKNWEMYVHDIETGEISLGINISKPYKKRISRYFKPNPERAAFLRSVFEKGFDDFLLTDIWPNLKCVEVCTTGAFESYEEKIRKYLQGISIFHRGLTASEGIFSVPIELNSKESMLLVESAFYEFIPVDAKDESETLTLNQLEVGREYELIITNLSGLYRYRMNDIIRIEGFYNKCPMIKCLGRKWEDLNIAGEKTGISAINKAVSTTCRELSDTVRGYSVYVEIDKDVFPRYVFLVEAENVSDKELFEKRMVGNLINTNEPLKKFIDKKEVGMPIIKWLASGTYEKYKADLRKEGVPSDSQIKPPIILKNPEKIAFFQQNINYSV